MEARRLEHFRTKKCTPLKSNSKNPWKMMVFQAIRVSFWGFLRLIFRGNLAVHFLGCTPRWHLECESLATSNCQANFSRPKNFTRFSVFGGTEGCFFCCPLGYEREIFHQVKKGCNICHKALGSKICEKIFFFNYGWWVPIQTTTLGCIPNP